MATGYWARKKGGGWLISLPPEVRRYLSVSHRMQLYWHCTRKGEAVLTVGPSRKAGRPEVTRLTRELAAASREIDAIKRRDDSRDRAMYAEGYNLGYLRAHEALVQPHGKSAEGQRRRWLYAYTFPKVAQVEAQNQVAPTPTPDRPRRNSRGRRSQRAAGGAQRQVETVNTPVLDAPVEVAAPTEPEPALR